MNNVKSLYELGKEYEKHISLQNFFIEKCREDIKKAKQKRDSDAVRELKSNLYKFYEMKRELAETASRLKNYYGQEDKNDSI